MTSKKFLSLDETRFQHPRNLPVSVFASTQNFDQFVYSMNDLSAQMLSSLMAVVELAWVGGGSGGECAK